MSMTDRNNKLTYWFSRFDGPSLTHTLSYNDTGYNKGAPHEDGLQVGLYGIIMCVRNGIFHKNPGLYSLC